MNFFQFFQKELPSRANSDADGLMAQAFNIKYNIKRMKKLEKEYTAIKSKEQEEMIELKVPRLISRILLRLRNSCKVCTC